MLPEKEISLEIKKRLVKKFMDVIVLRELENSSNLSGYDVVTLIHKKFDLLVSPGTAYALLYSMERKGLIEATVDGGRRVYKLSETGLRVLHNISKHGEEIWRLAKSMFNGAVG
jgi:DNA-binding PadR family transcriptional regulator